MYGFPLDFPWDTLGSFGWRRVLGWRPTRILPTCTHILTGTQHIWILPTRRTFVVERAPTFYSYILGVGCGISWVWSAKDDGCILVTGVVIPILGSVAPNAPNAKSKKQKLAVIPLCYVLPLYVTCVAALVLYCRAGPAVGAFLVLPLFFLSIPPSRCPFSFPFLNSPQFSSFLRFYPALPAIRAAALGTVGGSLSLCRVSVCANVFPRRRCLAFPQPWPNDVSSVFPTTYLPNDASPSRVACFPVLVYHLPTGHRPQLACFPDGSPSANQVSTKSPLSPRWLCGASPPLHCGGAQAKLKWCFVSELELGLRSDGSPTRGCGREHRLIFYFILFLDEGDVECTDSDSDSGSRL
ncbi:hypothetical protein C8R44DRAFT_723914 [Mycena epipterygia]|nr:hypothetical protein C8R44DRAFT_723914 [Mycena epipterygia]